METSQPGNRNTHRPAWRTVLARLIVFALLWWALTEGDTYNLWFGVVMVVVATIASLALQPVTRMRPWHFLTIAPYFIRESVVGGIDVARRSFAPDLPIQPAIVEVPMRLPEGPARVFLVTMMNLTPGTVGVELQRESLRLHMLDRHIPIEQRIRDMEDRIAPLFGVALDEPRS